MTGNTSAEITMRRYGTAGATELLEQLGDVYADARSEPPYDAGPLWRRDAFLARTGRQVNDLGFVLVSAYAGDVMVGFAFGRPLGPAAWFEGDTTPPDDILAATKFAVTELNVRKAWRNRGIGRRLLDELLAGRPETYAILSTMPNSPAWPLYLRWGWRVVAHTLADIDFPYMDTFVLPLNPPSSRYRVSGVP